jgi:hypothetical protein
MTDSATRESRGITTRSTIVDAAMIGGATFAGAVMMGRWIGTGWSLLPSAIGLAAATWRFRPAIKRLDLERVIILLLVAGALIPFGFVGRTSFGLSADDVLPLLGGVLALRWGWRHRAELRFPWLLLPLGLMPLWGLVSALATGTEISSAVPVVFRLVYAAGLLTLAYNLGRVAGLRRFLVGTVVAVALLQAGLSLWAYLVEWSPGVGRFFALEPFKSYEPFADRVPGRTVGTLGVAGNFFGGYLIIPTLLAAGMASIAPRRDERYAWAAAALALETALLLTYTRAAVFAAVLALIGYVIVSRQWRLVVVLGVALVTLAVITPFGERLLVGNDRLALFGEAIDVIVDNPVTGVGPGNYIDPAETPAEPAGGEAESTDGGRAVTPHNSFLYYSSELGLPAGILFLLALAAVGAAAFGRGFDRRAPAGVLASAIAAGLGGVALQSMSNNLFQIPPVATQFWLVAGVAGWFVASAGGSSGWVTSVMVGSRDNDSVT